MRTSTALAYVRKQPPRELHRLIALLVEKRQRIIDETGDFPADDAIVQSIRQHKKTKPTRKVT